MQTSSFQVIRIEDGIYRVTGDGFPSGSALNRYGFLAPDGEPLTDPADDPELAALLAKFIVTKTGKAVGIDFAAEPGEDWIGLGDVTRERMYHRGHRLDCWVRNVKSYIPVPFILSTAGYAVLVNSTHRLEFDFAATAPNHVTWRDHGGRLDFYVMLGGSFLENIRLYTRLTGSPKLPPEWSFGLWYLCRQGANDYEAVNDAVNFRREGIPCDVLGLEPGWMEKDHDFSPDKKWSPERFPIQRWCQNGPHNFIDAIKRMGFHFELWECNEYDLVHEEERRLGRQIVESAHAGNFQEGAEADEHFSWPRFSDTVTRKSESWFEHHKKFIDQGIDFFKQDSAWQVCEHPDRVWGNKFMDGEMHNLYPLLYTRQMYEGFKSHTNRRPVTFTVAGWTGFQAHAGTWSGDTGGRLVTLGGMLNTAVMSHNWQTNDMEVMQPEGIHFGYLQPWSQINSWAYFRMPWVQGTRLLELHKFYSRFRARLIPYIYSWAEKTAAEGVPLLFRPLQIEFEHDTGSRDIMHQYLLGRDLLVGIYKRELWLPPGRWRNFWDGSVHEGGQLLSLDWPEDRGGHLFMREGAIIPLGPVMQYRKEKPLDEIECHLFPASTQSTFDLYEDDGISFDFQSGKSSRTRITCHCDAGIVHGEVSSPAGDFPLPPNRTWTFAVALEKEPSAVIVNGKTTTEFRWDITRHELFFIGGEGPLQFQIQLN